MARILNDYWAVKDLGPEENDGVLHRMTRELPGGEETYTFIYATLDFAEVVGVFDSYMDMAAWLDNFKSRADRYVSYINWKRTTI